MPRCASCGADNQERDRFCGQCGSVLDAACPVCGEPVEAGRRYCGQCGTALAGATTIPETLPQFVREASRPVAERRLCSVLFADLVGFTPLSESRDPEDVREILSRYFDVCRSLISRYGGIVEKFIGDAVMAVWGTPIATEEDAERAVRAAIDLLGAIEALGAEVGAVGLSARAGIVTGEVAVTIGARGEGMVAGDAVNTASRVQSVARAGVVFVDEATKRLAERAIEFENEGTRELKGKDAPEHLFRAVRVLSGVGGKQRADGLEAPLIGRAAEFRAIKDFFHTSVERRTPRLVVVAGPAGVGKSRLGWEFEKYTDGLADMVWWHRGRCLSYGEGVAYWALAEIIRQRFGIAEEDAIDVAETKLLDGMNRFVSDEAAREYVGVRLSRLLGISYPSESRAVLEPDELYAGWRLFFERLAAVAPVVMLVEDAQHADEGLLGFFDHLIDWTRDLPIFVLLFARPGLAVLDSGYGVGRNRSTLSLDPLDDNSMAELVESLVPGMPRPARQAITGRAQGIPLFAVETIRSLIDRGTVRRDDDGPYQLAGDLGELRVPGSLHSLLAARLDALPPEVRSLVAVASVVGTSFPKEALVAVSGQSADAVQAALSELVRRDVLEIFADPLSPERGSYRFSQQMLRQVAYETLSKKDRKAHHLAVAAHLREVFANEGEEIADVIAQHYLDARAAAPGAADAGALGAEALHYLLRAAERADRSGAPARAAEMYAEAARIAPPEESPRLLERAAFASYTYGDPEKSLAYVEEARASHAARGDRRGEARARSLKGRILQFAGRSAAARDELRAAVSVLRADPDPDTVEALRRLATIEVFSGNLEAGKQLVEEALELAQAVDVDTLAVARLFDAKGHAAVFANRQIEAAIYYEAAAHVAERAGSPGTVAVAQHNLADILARTDPRRAVEVGRSAAEHARRTGRRPSLGLAVANLAIALLELGEWDDAEKELRLALEVDHVDDEDAFRLTGWLAGLRGDPIAAAAALEQLSESRVNEEPQMQASVLFLESLIGLSRGDVKGALSKAMAVLDKCAAIGIGHESQRWAWPLAARAARALGDTAALRALLPVLDAHPLGHLPPVLRANGRLLRALLQADAQEEGGLAGVGEAVVTLRGVGNPYQLAHGLIDYAGVLARDGEPGDDVALAEAREIAKRLRCTALLARADVASRGT